MTIEDLSKEELKALLEACQDAVFELTVVCGNSSTNLCWALLGVLQSLNQGYEMYEPNWNLVMESVK